MTADVTAFGLVAKCAAILSIILIVLTGLYFMVEPFDEFAKWYAIDNVFPKALLLVLAPKAAALANQIKRNLAEQAKRQGPKSVKRAFNQATKEQTREMVMGWLI